MYLIIITACTKAACNKAIVCSRKYYMCVLRELLSQTGNINMAAKYLILVELLTYVLLVIEFSNADCQRNFFLFKIHRKG